MMLWRPQAVFLRRSEAMMLSTPYDDDPAIPDDDTPAISACDAPDDDTVVILLRLPQG